MISTACGVDFGTSNSTVGWSRPDQRALLALEDGKTTLPSAIFFHDEDAEVSYGRAAISDYLAGYDGRLMRSMKSLLGSSLIDGSTEVQGRSIPFRVLLTRFIAELKRRAETAAGRDFTRAVLGRPVFFVDDNPAADQTAQDTLGEIARSVGFTDIEFQFEPLAAAFDYESQIDREELVLVIDIGGGTSDFSLIRLGPGRAAKPDRRDDILAYGGVHIGGVDFDKQLSLAHVMPLLGLGSQLRSGKDVPSTQYGNLACWHTINQAYTRKAAEHFAYIRAEAGDRDKIDLLLNLVKQRAGHWVAVQVEEAKIALSEAPAAHRPVAHRARTWRGREPAVVRQQRGAADREDRADRRHPAARRGRRARRCGHGVLHRRFESRAATARMRLGAGAAGAQRRGRPVRQHRRRPGAGRAPQVRLRLGRRLPPTPRGRRAARFRHHVASIAGTRSASASIAVRVFDGR